MSLTMDDLVFIDRIAEQMAELTVPLLIETKGGKSEREISKDDKEVELMQIYPTSAWFCGNAQREVDE